MVLEQKKVPDQKTIDSGGRGFETCVGSDRQPDSFTYLFDQIKTCVWLCLVFVICLIYVSKLALTRVCMCV